MKPSYIKNALRKTIVSMSSNIELFVKNPGKDFTRNRKITFRDILVSTISLESHSLNHEMRKFFFKQGVNIPSKSALIQQRDKLNDNVFRHLFLEFNGRIPFKKTFKGYHLLACDGSDLNLPPLKSDNKTRVSSNTKDVYYHQAHLNAIYDLLEQRYTDILIQPRAEYNERTAFIDFIRRNQVPGKCIFIADRGYFSVNVLAHLLSSGQFFLIRMMEEGHGAAFLKRFKPPKDNEFDIMISLEATRSNKRLYTGQPVKYYVIHKNRQFDFIPKEDKTTLYPMTFRAIKLILPNGNAEYLITNLPQETFDITALSELYFMRWGIETSFRHLKYNMSLNSFHSIRRDFIEQEIYAKVILYNFTLLLAQCVIVSQKSRKYHYKVAISDATVTARYFLIHAIKNQEMEILLLKYLTDIRHDRSFPRKVRSKRYISFNNRD